MTPPTTYHHDDGTEHNCYGYQKDRDKFQPRISYTVESRKLIITIPSVPRYLYNTGLIMMNDEMVPLFYYKLRRHLVDELNVQDLPQPADWLVREADIYQDFQVGVDAQHYIEALKQIKIPKFKEGNYRNETVYWRNGAKEIKFYDKCVCAVDKGENPAFVESCKGLLRLEVGIKAAEFSRLTGSNKLGDIFKE